MKTVAVDLFAGPGGWDVAARNLGIRSVGIEWDRDACETRRAAVLPTIHGDVRDYGPADFPHASTLIGSPPCQTFSAAGKGAGRAALSLVLDIAKMMAARESVADMLSDVSDERTALVLEPLRWALDAVDAGRPFQTIVLEQVPTVLPVWDVFAGVLRAEGYSVATGRLSAEEYGVPQTRRRAFLVARRMGAAVLPTPTHRKYRKGVGQDAGDAALLPWVSMAEALSWGMTHRPAFTVLAGTANGGADPACVGGSASRRALYAERDAGRWVQRSNYSDGSSGSPGRRGRGFRPLSAPSATVTSKAHEWVPEAEVGAPTTRIRVSPDEAAVLQSFPAGFPWRGTKTSTYQQIGNAVPPVLAAAVLRAAVGS